MIRRPFALMAAAALLGGVQAPAPTAPAAVVQAQQVTKAALPAQKVSRRAVRQALLYYGVNAVGGRAPWVNKHGYLLRQVARPISWRIR